ncbi:GNAT family N-acetyltransferase [Amycolatopsis sp. OK19-0408]|uniref:GNAT family N-acetyltransferase n=1 Tax=Amycolatopsis iheyensis TaxID=2945988 RepID=A0A9X2NJ69_9PSEU|nr:GNAT family N-acetyltransferase [Amycolatopsis iheyensis]MCR6485820.1 GNAT family N-acetyltransferase [Amycolatopsis iheyensis]
MTGLLTERLQQACDNAVAMWTALARARGDDVRERPAYTAIDGRRFRIMVTTAAKAGHGELTELAREKREAGRTVVVEDPFRVLDLSAAGFTARQLPVMVREPGPAADPGALTRLSTAAEVEDIIVRGFPLEEYEGGGAFPETLAHPDLTFFRHGDAGACVTMRAGGVGGAYWVTTLPEHRSRGVGRALMLAVLRHFDDLPVTLTASRAGKPLYDKLGFDVLGDANWWR